MPKTSKIINLFGGPGIGKSSIAAGLTHALKKKHIKVDMPYEFPKQLAWDNNGEAIKDQLYVLANQHRGIAKAFGKVKYIILDSPIFLSLIYKNMYASGDAPYPQRLYKDLFDEFIVDLFKQYDNVNILLKRDVDGDFNEDERYQSLEESIRIDQTIKETMEKYDIPYFEVLIEGDAVKEIMQILKRNE